MLPRSPVPRKRPARALAAALAALTLLLATPSAPAGTAANPEIRDEVNEVEVHPVLVNVPVPEIDIAAAWVSSDATGVHFHVQVVDLAHRTLPDQRMEYVLTYADDRHDSATAIATFDGTTWSFLFTASTPDGAFAQAQGEGVLMEDTLHFWFPRVTLQGPVQDLKASTILLVRYGENASGGGTIWARDWSGAEESPPSFVLTRPDPRSVT